MRRHLKPCESADFQVSEDNKKSVYTQAEVLNMNI
jgi:hypothetical protein